MLVEKAVIRRGGYELRANPSSRACPLKRKRGRGRWNSQFADTYKFPAGILCKSTRSLVPRDDRSKSV